MKTSSANNNRKENNNNKKKYYAVASGRKPGVYETWDECKKQVFSFPNAQHKVSIYFPPVCPSLLKRCALIKESLESDINALPFSLLFFFMLLKSFSARADAEAWVKTNVIENPSSSSIAAEMRTTISTTQKRKAHTNNAKQTSMKEYLEDKQEDFDDDDGWTTEYEPMKPLSSPPAKRTGKSLKPNGNNTKRKLNTKASAENKTSTKGEKGFGDKKGEGQLPFVLEFDGASRGNPGPAGAGALIRAPRIPSQDAFDDNSDAREEEEEEERCGEIIKEICTSLGVATVNEAEYHALITGLKAAIELGIEDIRVRGDSNLIVSQVKGDWKVKEPRLIPLHAECNEMKKKFRRFDIAHVRREFNKDADALANSAIDDGTHTNDYEYKMSGGGGFNGGGGEGLGGGNANAAARMVRRAHYANIARATLCTMRFARIALL